MDIIEQANHRANLILPKLEHLRTQVGGGKIHDVLVWLSIVRNNQKLMSTAKKTPPEEIAVDLIIACDEAEKFMMEVVR